MQKQVLHPYVTMDRRISNGSPVIVGTRIVDSALEYAHLGSTPDVLLQIEKREWKHLKK